MRDECIGEASEPERWFGTVFQRRGVTIRCYRWLRTNQPLRDEQIAALALWLERMGLATPERRLRDGIRRRDLALATRTARRLEVDPKLRGVAMTVAVCNGTITVEGTITPGQCDAVTHAVRGIRSAHRVVAALRIATIAPETTNPPLTSDA